MGDRKNAAGKRLPRRYITVQQRKPRKILNTVNKKLPFIGNDVKKLQDIGNLLKEQAMPVKDRKNETKHNARRTSVGSWNRSIA